VSDPAGPVEPVDPADPADPAEAETVDDVWGHFVVAMDGTAGSGKSSASRGVATRLGLRYLDTGAMYRAMTWKMLLDGVDVADPEAVAAHAPSADIGIGTSPELPTIALDGADVSREIRSDAATAAVSAVSAVPRVRELLRNLQRAIIGHGGIVVEGRDIGTVVVPEARLKVYLTADPIARALRRSAEMAADQERDVAVVEAELLRRDRYDSTRAASPLAAAPDAVVLDTTELTLDEVIDRVVGLARERAVAARASADE
jgi:cytidylate kinase